MNLSELKGKKKNRVSYDFYEYFKSAKEYKDTFSNMSHNEIKTSLRDNDFKALEAKDIEILKKAGFTKDIEFIIDKYSLSFE